jgi:hypothetical protein
VLFQRHRATRPTKSKQERWNALMAQAENLARRLKRKVDTPGGGSSSERSRGDGRKGQFNQIAAGRGAVSRSPPNSGGRRNRHRKIRRADRCDLHGSVADSNQRWWPAFNWLHGPSP